MIPLCLDLVLAFLQGPGAAAPARAAPTVLNDDGGWCWFQDERALVAGDLLVFGSVAAGVHDPGRRGDVDVTVRDLRSGSTRIVALHTGLELDDHAAPALLVRPDGRFLAVYSRHGGDRLVRTRVSTHPGDAREWGPERTTAVESAESGVTYSNLFLVPSPEGGAGRILDFHRGRGWDPNWLVSDDQGETWTYGGRLLGGPGRPYVKYAADGRGAIHFVATEQHPRDFDNGLYHGILRGGRVRSSDGTPVAAREDGEVRPEDLTPIFHGRPDAVAWPVDLEVGGDGYPRVVFSVQTDGAGLPPGEGGMDHRYHHARWDGSAWRVHEMAFAGTRLYPGEDDYTGLAALDPEDPDVVYVSTDADPATGRPLAGADGERHHEIFRGVTGDGGATWAWEAITRGSAVDNLRPVVPRGSPERTVLLWLRGTYRSYTDYELEVVGLVFPR